MREVLDFLCAESEGLASTLTFPELFVLHTDPDLQLREALSIGGRKKPEESLLLRDYLALFGMLVPVEVLVEPTIRAIAERWETDRPSAEKDFAMLDGLVQRSDIRSLLQAEVARVNSERALGMEEEIQAEAATSSANARSLLQAIGLPDPSPDLIRTTSEYIEYLVYRCRYVDFRGMGVANRVPLRMPLLDLYVPLRARRMPGQETVPLLNLLREQPGLMLLGDPGSGKTTFLKYLSLALATGQGAALGLGARLPVLLSLAEYVDVLANREISLEDFGAYANQPLGIGAPLHTLLKEVLGRGRALLLLDGLDEVREPELRVLVVRRAQEFLRHWPAGNKLVLTSRIVGYRERQEVEGLVEATLVGFEDDGIKLFASQWTVALEQAVAGDSTLAFLAATREREELWAAIQANPGVRELAANPLLLTILALMNRERGVLPERRIELYRASTETLLQHWQLARGLGRRLGIVVDAVDTTRILALVALWMQQVAPGKGLVPEEDLYWKLVQIFEESGYNEPELGARQFLEDVQEHSGMLVERGHRLWGFVHLIFQEYLAAVALAQQAQAGVGEVTRVLAEHAGEPAWREVSLLTVSYLAVVQHREEVASVVIESLLQVDEPLGWAVLLAGEALADAGPGGLTASCRKQVIEALLSTMQDEKAPAQVRLEAVRILAQLGSSRNSR